MAWRRRAGCGLLGALLIAFVSSLAAELLPFDAAERARIVARGPWPPTIPPDTGNRVSGRPTAIAFGEMLFSNPSLSTVGGLRCASCHEAWRSLVDGRALALGAEPGQRNTLPLFNLGLNRWFGWDGANDSLWAQSVRPLLDPREMRASPAHVANLVRNDETLRELYLAAFAAAPAADDDAVLADVGKALAAFQETLVSARTPFDDFRDALARGDRNAAARYPVEAQRGLRTFEGRGRCAACHAGATFSDGGFHRSLIVSTEPDRGRQAGVQSLLANRFNLLGRFNDGADRTATQRASDESRSDGAFRTPSLREVATTGPYMHDGSVANLCDALRPHAVPAVGGDAPPLSLAERHDLVAFLRSLGATAESPLVDPAIFRCR